MTGRFQGARRDSLRGFFLQEADADADADPATSEGIFVYEGGSGLARGILVGDRVRVTGTATEHFGSTELTALVGVESCANGVPLPKPALLPLPVPGVPSGDLGAARAAIDAHYERFEGMRVAFPSTLSVSDLAGLERWGQLVLTEGGRIQTFTADHAPSATGSVDHRIDVARRSVILDDRDDRQDSARTNGKPLPYPPPGLSITHRLRSGDTITGLTGVLDWSFAGAAGTEAWRVRPVAETGSYTFAPANPRPRAPPGVGGRLRVASFNVRNYFTTIDDGRPRCGPTGKLDCRGADSASELRRQTAKLVAALCAMRPDIAGLMEIENDASASVSALVNAANAVPGCGPFGFVNTGAIGSDAIKVALLYRVGTVAPVGSPAILDASVDPRFLDTRNRPSLAQTFRELATGEKLTLAVNHFKSKGSTCADIGDPDVGDGQGNCSRTRTTAARALVDWLATDPTGSGDPDFLIIGDLNSYAQEDPMRAVRAGTDDTPGTGDDYTDLVAAFGGPSAYGFVFDGEIGYLDHALASPSLRPQVTGTAEWHIDADEPPAFDYDDTVVDPGESRFEAKPAALPLYAPDAYRSSDHDPVLIGLELQQATSRIEPLGVDTALSAAPRAARSASGQRRPTTRDGGAARSPAGDPRCARRRARRRGSAPRDRSRAAARTS